jgi:dipeptidyl-peptidase 4
VADVPTIQITDWEGQYPEWTVMPYPKVGEENSVVRIGVVDVETARTRWMERGAGGEHYVPRIYWTSDPNTLAVVTLNRPQNHLQLFFFDVRDGSRRLVMEERSEAWIDVSWTSSPASTTTSTSPPTFVSSSGSATGTATTTCTGTATTASC